MDWALFAEARSEDWQRRVAAEVIPTSVSLALEVESYASMLCKEVLGLRLQARSGSDPAEKQRMLHRAEGLRIQLMVNLERERPRMAHTLDVQLRCLSAQ